MKRSLLVLILCLTLVGLTACTSSKKQKAVGNVPLKLKDNTQTAQYYQAALKSNPDSVTLLTGLGRAYYNMGEYAKATEAFTHATHIQDYPMASFYLGITQIAKGEIQSGLTQLANFRYAGNPSITDAIRNEARQWIAKPNSDSETIIQSLFKAWDAGIETDKQTGLPKK